MIICFENFLFCDIIENVKEIKLLGEKVDKNFNEISQTALIGKNVVLGKNVKICDGCIIEDNVEIGENSLIEAKTIIRSGVKLGSNSIVGSNCIIGEHCMDFYLDRSTPAHGLHIGSGALIRSGTIIYDNSNIGENFQTGHNVTIREKSKIGCNVSVGTLSDIQGDCVIGNYVRMHSNVHIGQKSEIDDYVWIFPYVVLTNDPTPPSDNILGVKIHSFAIVATNAILLPGVEINTDSLVGAGAIVTKNVDKYAVVVGNPAKNVGDIRNIKDKKTGKNIYPWRFNFKRAMPWAESDFETWYNNLSITEKNKLNI